MSYPQKINRDTVLQAAVAYLEQHGMDALSMRTLAAELEVTPNALYRYFSSKAELEYAMADEAGRLLYQALEAAVNNHPPLPALGAVGMAYLHFARANPALYAVMTGHCKSDEEPASHAQIWDLAGTLLGSVYQGDDLDDLALSLWAYLHGLAELDRANMLEGRPTDALLATGMKVFLSGLTAAPQPPGRSRRAT